jgi:hypothetical protein
MQAPLPSQRAAEVSVDPPHVCGVQSDPREYLRQAPVPSHTPSVPQVAIPWSVQSLRGSVPTSAGRQVPTLPWAAQVTHNPLQAALQQTPSAQNPLAQALPCVHAVPTANPGAPPPSPGLPPSDAPPS